MFELRALLLHSYSIGTVRFKSESKLIDGNKNGEAKMWIPSGNESARAWRRYSANDVRFPILNVSTFIRFKTLRWAIVSRFWYTSARHQSFLEGFAYPSFLPASTSNFYIEWSPLNQHSVLGNRVLYYFLWINNIIRRGKGDWISLNMV